MKILLIALSSLIICACDKSGDNDGKTISRAFWVNNTSHAIEIRPYNLGSLRSNYIVTLQPGATKQIADELQIGKLNIGGGFGSAYLIGSDSIVVTFDNTYSITHYFFQPSTPVSKYYLYSSTRNLGNVHSYDAVIESESEHSANHKYTYTFIDQDFLDAK